MKFLPAIIGILFFVSCVNSENNAQTNTELEQEVQMSGEFEFDEYVLKDYELIWSWDGDFTINEKAKLTSWITEVSEETNKTLGQYQFDVHVTFIRSNSQNRPVPFGFARRRDGKNQIHLYVNPTASSDELMSDWTAQHEFSHLSIPFLGSKHKWFSEGFATFLSRQTMMDQGLYTQIEFDSLYHSKISEAKEYYNSSTKTFIEVSDSLVENHVYSDMYWGSSTFLFTMDKRLRKEINIRFVDVMKEYQQKYRSEDRSILDVIHSFDKVIGERYCSDLMSKYRNQSSAEIMKNY